MKELPVNLTDTHANTTMFDKLNFSVALCRIILFSKMKGPTHQSSISFQRMLWFISLKITLKKSKNVLNTFSLFLYSVYLYLIFSLSLICYYFLDFTSLKILPMSWNSPQTFSYVHWPTAYYAFKIISLIGFFILFFIVDLEISTKKW